jgi:N-acetylglucosaminyldiphosphoundecaprenol N-acetyl-beta-D-mannosaminyltransferase
MGAGAVTDLTRVNILGVGISAIDLTIAVDHIEQCVRSGTREYVCVCPVHSIMECRRSPDVRAVFNSAGMVTPDGMPVVWVARMMGHAEVRRVYGPDLMQAELESATGRTHRHLFYGGRPGVAQRLADAMARRYAGLRVAGVIEPPFASLDELCTPETAAAINAARPDVVWVGMSSPKQDRWMARMRPQLAAPVLIGVGAAFDFLSGTVSQAPRWMQRSGLEWVHRLGTDPRRLWRRYLVDNPWFVWDVALQMAGIKKFELA